MTQKITITVEIKPKQLVLPVVAEIPPDDCSVVVSECGTVIIDLTKKFSSSYTFNDVGLFKLEETNRYLVKAITQRIYSRAQIYYNIKKAAPTQISKYLKLLNLDPNDYEVVIDWPVSFHSSPPEKCVKFKKQILKSMAKREFQVNCPNYLLIR